MREAAVRARRHPRGRDRVSTWTVVLVRRMLGSSQLRRGGRQSRGSA